MVHLLTGMMDPLWISLTGEKTGQPVRIVASIVLLYDQAEQIRWITFGTTSFVQLKERLFAKKECNLTMDSIATTFIRRQCYSLMDEIRTTICRLAGQC